MRNWLTCQDRFIMTTSKIGRIHKINKFRYSTEIKMWRPIRIQYTWSTKLKITTITITVKRTTRASKDQDQLQIEHIPSFSIRIHKNSRFRHRYSQHRRSKTQIFNLPNKPILRYQIKHPKTTTFSSHFWISKRMKYIKIWICTRSIIHNTIWNFQNSEWDMSIGDRRKSNNRSWSMIIS